MLLQMAKDQWLLQTGPGSTDFATDPVRLGPNDRATMTLFIRSMTPGSVVGNVVLSMSPEVTNDPSKGWNDDFSGTENDSASDVPYLQVAGVNGLYVRFRFKLTVIMDTGLKKALFDAQVLLDKA